MKHIVSVILILFLAVSKSYSWEGIGVSVGGGGFKYLTEEKTLGVMKWYGYSYSFGCQVPLVESHLTELEFMMHFYWRQETDLISGPHYEKYGTPSYGLRFYFFGYKSDFRPGILFGASTIPGMSWVLSPLLDYRVFKNTHLHLSSYFILDGLVQLAGYDNPPAIFTLSVKHYFK